MYTKVMKGMEGMCGYIPAPPPSDVGNTHMLMAFTTVGNNTNRFDGDGKRAGFEFAICR